VTAPATWAINVLLDAAAQKKLAIRQKRAVERKID
jgi:hypothetical protein